MSVKKEIKEPESIKLHIGEEIWEAPFDKFKEVVLDSIFLCYLGKNSDGTYAHEKTKQSSEHFDKVFKNLYKKESKEEIEEWLRSVKWKQWIQIFIRIKPSWINYDEVLEGKYQTITLKYK